NGRGVFGSDFGSCSFVIRNTPLPNYKGVYRRLFDKPGSVATNDELERRFGSEKSCFASPHDFKQLPGEVIAYWTTPNERNCFTRFPNLQTVAAPRQGLATSDDGRFLRLWHEVAISDSCFDAGSHEEAKASKKKWFPFHKGGAFRRWYGNQEYLINWENDGKE